MRRSYIYQTTPPAEFFGSERAQLIHAENLVRRAACDAQFTDARVNKKKYENRKRSRKRCEKNKAETDFARRRCESKAARAERGAQPRNRKRVDTSPPLRTGLVAADLSTIPCLTPFLDANLERLMDGAMPFSIASAHLPDECSQLADLA